MRVLWPHNFDPSNPFAGSFMYTSAQALAQQGVEVELMYLGNLRRPSAIPAAMRRVARASARFDVTHAQFGSACALSSATSHSRAKVVSLRGSDWTPAFSSHLVRRAHGRIARTFTLRALPRFDAVITMSHRIADEVRFGNPSATVVYLPDPIDLNLFHSVDRSHAREALGLDEGKKYIAFTSINKTNELKRPELAQAAVVLARQVDPTIELLPLTGVPHDRMPLYLSAANLALSTSTSEGWPNCIKEALACGIPFVSTDVSDLNAIAQRMTGCAVTDPTPSALASGILESLAQQPDVRLRTEIEHMSVERHGAELAALYRRLLEDKS